MKAKKIFIFMFTFLIALFLSTNNSSISFAATSSTGVTLSATVAYLVKGETTALKVTGTSAKAAWTSNNKKVATVSSSGKVTAVGYGTAIIAVTVNKKSYSCEVTVVDPSGLYLEPSSTTVMVDGDEVNLNLKSYSYSAGAIKKMGVIYKVTGNDGIKVSSAGKVTAVKAGKFKVTVYIHGKKIETVSMAAEQFRGFSDAEVHLDTKADKEIYFADNYKPNYEEVKVTSSDDSVVSVEPAFTVEDMEHYYGIEITGVADGTATVSVTVSGVTKQIKVVVGVGATVLAPVDAVKTGNYTGYTGNSLATLKWVRDFIDANNLMSDAVTDRQKVTIIQNYFTQVYKGELGDSAYKGGTSRLLFDGYGVCGDFADTFCFLCDCIELPCYLVGGVADGDGGWGPHAWNKVKVDGNWFYIDTYWCACLRSTDKYFLTTDLWSDHKSNVEGYYSDVMIDDTQASYTSDIL